MEKYDSSKCKSEILRGYSGCHCEYCQWYRNQKSRWVVNVLGDHKCYEISIVREANRHGQASWGWFDKTKIFIADCDRWKQGRKEIFKIHKKTAKALVDKKNRKEGFK